MAVVTVKISPLDQNNAAFSVEQPYLRNDQADATLARAFFVLGNQTGKEDRLIGAESDVAEMVELHSETKVADGGVEMGEIEGGVALADGESHVFGPSGDHLMFFGLTGPLVQGQLVPVTLKFEVAGDVEIVVPVDQTR
nr:copper chaperone PCu(A)C [Sulfitobacter undariae]